MPPIRTVSHAAISHRQRGQSAHLDERQERIQLSGSISVARSQDRIFSRSLDATLLLILRHAGTSPSNIRSTRSQVLFDSEEIEGDDVVDSTPYMEYREARTHT
eukprot:4171201-Pleurochrysis_carterae.AAC.1